MQKTRLRGVKIGVVLTGSHCTIAEVLPQIKNLKEEGADIYPIFSYTVDEVDNRFYKVNDLKKDGTMSKISTKWFGEDIYK